MFTIMPNFAPIVPIPRLLLALNGKTGSHLLELVNNSKGEVCFEGNKLSASTPRVIITDKISKKPKHDVEKIEFKVMKPYNPTQSYSAKERSAFTKALKKRGQRDGHIDIDKIPVFEWNKYKHCFRCLVPEDMEALRAWSHGESCTPKEKFLYCGRCRKVTYCSKKCKDAHWPDHRPVCEGNSPA